MSSIDKRIVQMQFDNQGFEKGVNATMKSLNSLNQSLKMKGATNGLSEVNSSMNKLTSLGIGALSTGVESVTSKFNALGIIAATALMNITNRVIDAGRNFTNAFTLAPITDGFSEYETKMNSIQTILTNTQSKGTTLDDVVATLNELNEYADQTIYNFAEMTRNIGTFTAAGIDLDRSATAIKGIANLAAGSGSSAAQASTAMYQLSQALAAGKVGLQDWNSVVNAGMGGELFQNALKDTAKQLGIVVDKSKPFRETLQDNWLTSEVLIKTLEKFAEDESLLKAATEVKTFTQLIDTMKESVGSGWAVSWEHIIGDKEQAAEFFTAVSDGFNNIIQPSTDARNAMLETWNKDGGRTAVIEGLTNIANTLIKTLGAISDAWKDVFPSMTGEKLIELSNKFKELTEKIKMSDKTARKIKNTFKGLFNIFRLGVDVIVAVVSGIKPLGKIFDGMGTSILSVTSKIGKMFTELKKSADDIGVFEAISSGVKTASEEIAQFLLGVRNVTGTMIGYLADLDFSSFFNTIGKGFAAIAKFLKPIIKGIGDAIGTVDFGTMFDIVQAGSTIKVVQILSDMFGEVSDVAESTKGIIGSFKGIGSGIKETLSAVTDSLVTFQKDLNASILLKISGAIAILAGSLLLISSIDKNKMIGGLMGLAVVFGELAAAYIVMSKFGSFKGMFKLGGFMLTFATSIAILSSALKKLSEVDPGGLMTGIIGLTSVMLIAVSASKMMSKNKGNFISTATGLVIFSSALHIMGDALEKIGSIDADVVGSGLITLSVLLGELALFMAGAKFGGLGISSATGILILSSALLVLQKAVEGFGSMEPETIIVGLTGIAGILSEIVLFSAISAGGLTLIGLGTALNLMATGLLILAESVRSFGRMSWEEIGRGLVAMAGGLTIIGAASMVISGIKMSTVAVGVAAMSTSVALLGSALKVFGSMSWEEIGRAMVALAGSLTILAAAMYAMTGGVVGAAALVVVAGAIAILTPQLLMLSQLSLEGIAVALLAMAGSFTVLGVAALALTPVIPSLIGLSGAIALIGVGALGCGAGLALLGTGITAIGVAVGGSGLLIVEFLKQLLNLLPKLGKKAGEAIVNFVKAIGDGSTQIVSSLTKLVSEMLKSLSTLTPQMIQLAIDVIVALCEGLAEGGPKVVESGFKLLLGILEGISSNIQQVVEVAGDCVINFLNGVANKLPDIIKSGINLSLSFIEGVADGLIENQDRIERAMEQIIYALITTGVSIIKGGIKGFASSGRDLLQGAIDGIESNWPGTIDAVKGAISGAISAASNLGTKLLQSGKDLITGLINGVKTKAIEMKDAAKGVIDGAINTASNLGTRLTQAGKDLITGLKNGVSSKAQEIKTNVKNTVDNAINTATVLGTRLTQAGKDLITGLKNGISSKAEEIKTNVRNTVNNAINTSTTLGTKLLQAGKDLITGLKNGVSNKATEIKNTVKTTVNNAISTSTSLGSKLLQAGKDLITGFKNGVNNKATEIKNTVKNTINNAINTITGMSSKLLQKGKDLIQGFINGVKNKATEAKNSVKNTVNNAVSAVSGLGTKLYQAGRDLIQGFMNGIKSKAQAVWDAAVGVANNAISAVKKILGIRSPSRVFKQIGAWTSEGMSIGLDRYAYMATDSASRLADNVIDNVKSPLSNISRMLNDDIDVNPTISPVLDLSNVSKGARLLNDMVGDKDLRINAHSRAIAGSVGKIQNRYDNSDIIGALNGLKEQLNNNTPSYTINGITYDDGSNVSAAVQSLVRAARIERRL